MMDAKFRSRKFILAMTFTIVGSIALLIGAIDGGAYTMLAGSVLALYGAANVGYRYVAGDTQ